MKKFHKGGAGGQLVLNARKRLQNLKWGHHFMKLFRKIDFFKGWLPWESRYEKHFLPELELHWLQNWTNIWMCWSRSIFSRSAGIHWCQSSPWEAPNCSTQPLFTNVEDLASQRRILALESHWNRKDIRSWKKYFDFHLWFEYPWPTLQWMLILQRREAMVD